jgi:hypothetical protein
MPNHGKILQSLLTAVILGTAFAVLIGIGWVAILDAIQEAGYDKRAASQEEEVVVENLILDTQGEPFFTTSLRRGNEYQPAAMVSAYQDKSGKFIENRNVSVLNQAHLWLESQGKATDLSWEQRLLIFSDERITEPKADPLQKTPFGGPMVSAQTYWYLVRDGYHDGSAYFVGFDCTSYSKIGYLGTLGFRPDGVPEGERFRVKPGQGGLFGGVTTPQGYWSCTRYPRESYSVRPSQPRGVLGKVILRAEDGLYRVDFWDRTVKRISEIPPDGMLSRVQLWAGPVNLVDSTYYLPIRTSERIITLNLEGNVISEAKLPASLREVDHLTFYKTPEGRRFGVMEDTQDEARGQRRVAHITEFSADGTVIANRDIPFPGPPTPIYHGENEGRWLAAAAYVLTGPIPADVTFLLLGPLEGTLAGTRTYSESFRDMCVNFKKSGFGSVILYLIFSHLFPLFWAAVAWRWAGRYGLPLGQKKVWATFAYLFGLPGLFGFLVHRKWPLREACPHCGREVPVDQDACVACGEAFPGPEAKGIEVFA